MTLFSTDASGEFEPRNNDPQIGRAESRLVPAIEFRDVYLAFDDQVILDGVNFSVRRGETKIVLGGSGSGK